MQGNPKAAWLPAHRLWLRGGEHVWRVLAAEENFFKEIAVSGLWFWCRNYTEVISLHHDSTL